MPKVTWWRDHALIDSSDTSRASFKTENELVLKDLQRDDLHSILTCQATNNNISVPVSTSVKLDMNCKFSRMLSHIDLDDVTTYQSTTHTISKFLIQSAGQIVAF
jgi:hypothetical protein